MMKVIYLFCFTLVFLENSLFADQSCTPDIISFEVRGSSLSGIIENGQNIQVDQNYYKCHSVKRGDIIVFHHGLKDRFIKQVHVIPGDHFELRQIGAAYHLFVNTKAVVNLKNKPFQFIGKRYQMIKLYVDSFHGEMPKKTYFVLGTDSNGTNDSGQFGPITDQAIIGKVLIERK